MKIPRWQQAHPHIGLLPARKNACSRAHMQAFSHEKYLEVRNFYVKCLNWIGLIQINPRTKKQKSVQMSWLVSWRRFMTSMSHALLAASMMCGIKRQLW